MKQILERVRGDADRACAIIDMHFETRDAYLESNGHDLVSLWARINGYIRATAPVVAGSIYDRPAVRYDD